MATQNPTHEVVAGVHKLFWPDYSIHLAADHIRRSREGVTGEFSISYKGVDGQLRLASSLRLSLSSAISQGQFVSSLQKAVADSPLATLPWQRIVAQAALKVLEHERQGEPAVLLRDVPIRERVRWRLEPLLAEGEITFFYGDGGSLKSYVALLCCLLIDGPVPAEISGLKLNPEPGTPLYLDWEADKWTLQERVNQMNRGFGLEENSHSIVYRRCVHPLVDDIENVRRLVAEHGADLVVVDSMGMACGGEQKEELIIPTLKAMRSLECSVIVVDHLAKERPRRGMPKPIGSIYKENEARSTFYLRKQQEPNSSQALVALYHVKVNNGRPLPPRALQFTFSGEEPRLTLKVTAHDFRETPEFAEDLPLHQRMEALLSHGAMSTAEVAEALACSEGTLRSVLKRYSARFTRLTNGAVGLALPVREGQDS